MSSSGQSSSMMDTVVVTVQYFAGLKDFTKVAEEKLQVPADLQVKDFFTHLLSKQPSLATERGRALLDTCACAIDLEYVDVDHDTSLLRNGAEIALIPPVSGG